MNHQTNVWDVLALAYAPRKITHRKTVFASLGQLRSTTASNKVSSLLTEIEALAQSHVDGCRRFRSVFEEIQVDQFENLENLDEDMKLALFVSVKCLHDYTENFNKKMSYFRDELNTVLKDKYSSCPDLLQSLEKFYLSMHENEDIEVSKEVLKQVEVTPISAWKLPTVSASHKSALKKKMALKSELLPKPSGGSCKEEVHIMDPAMGEKRRSDFEPHETVTVAPAAVSRSKVRAARRTMSYRRYTPLDIELNVKKERDRMAAVKDSDDYEEEEFKHHYVTETLPKFRAGSDSKDVEESAKGMTEFKNKKFTSIPAESSRRLGMSRSLEAGMISSSPLSEDREEEVADEFNPYLKKSVSSFTYCRVDSDVESMDDLGDPEWDDDARRQCRKKKIRERIPTGHPQQLMETAEQLVEDDLQLRVDELSSSS